MLGVLTGIARRLANLKMGTSDGMEEFVGKEEDLRKRILAAGLEAISERGSVGAHAIEVVWECIVGWDPNVANVEGVELDPLSRASIDILPLEYVLPHIATILQRFSQVLCTTSVYFASMSAAKQFHCNQHSFNTKAPWGRFADSPFHAYFVDRILVTSPRLPCNTIISHSCSFLSSECSKGWVLRSLLLVSVLSKRIGVYGQRYGGLRHPG